MNICKNHEQIILSFLERQVTAFTPFANTVFAFLIMCGESITVILLQVRFLRANMIKIENVFLHRKHVCISVIQNRCLLSSK